MWWNDVALFSQRKQFRFNGVRDKSQIQRRNFICLFSHVVQIMLVIETTHPNAFDIHRRVSEIHINGMNCNVFFMLNRCDVAWFCLCLRPCWESARVVSFMRFVFLSSPFFFRSVFHSLKHFWMWIHSCLIAHVADIKYFALWNLHEMPSHTNHFHTWYVRRCVCRSNAVQKHILSIWCVSPHEAHRKPTTNWVKKELRMEKKSPARVAHMNAVNEAQFLTKHVFEHVPRFLKQTKCQLEIVCCLFYLRFRCGYVKKKMANIVDVWLFPFFSSSSFFSLAYQWSDADVWHGSPSNGECYSCVLPFKSLQKWFTSCFGPCLMK